MTYVMTKPCPICAIQFLVHAATRYGSGSTERKAGGHFGSELIVIAVGAAGESRQPQRRQKSGEVVEVKPIRTAERRARVRATLPFDPQYRPACILFSGDPAGQNNSLPVGTRQDGDPQ